MNAPLPPNATTVASLAVAEIVASPSNPRKHFDDAYLAELADSMKSHGVIQPITVRPLSLDALFAFNKRAHPDVARPTYEIVVGECRWRAAKLAGLAEIPAFWRDLDDKQVLEIQVVENLQRRDVHPLEEAEGYQALITRHGYSADTLAAKIGKSRAYIYGRLKLTALCKPAREEFFAGKLDSSTALLIARIPGEALQKKATKEVLTGGWGGDGMAYRAAKSHIRLRYTLSLKQATFKPDDATLLPIAGACSACPKLSGNFHDLFNDIEDADVCTDPDCFEAKRLARRAQLIAHFEQRKLPVVTDDNEARKYFHNTAFIALDDTCYEDAEDRSYRDILGDTTPVVALVQRPWGDREVIEFADATAIAQALRKAGWKPAAPEIQPPPKNETAAEKAARLADEEAAAAAREAKEQEREQAEIQAEAETARRIRLRDAALARLPTLKLHVSDEADGLIRAMVCAWLAQEFDGMGIGEFEGELHTYLGIELPEEFDDDAVLGHIHRAIDAAPLGELIALMLDPMTRHKVKVHWTSAGTTNPTLEYMSKALRIDEPASTHSEAAHAGDKPAPPAAPVKTNGLHPAQAWPFQTGARI